MKEIQEIIERAWEDRDLLAHDNTRDAITEAVSMLDRGLLRVAEKHEGDWIVHDWVKKAVILYFPLRKMQTLEVGPFESMTKFP